MSDFHINKIRRLDLTSLLIFLGLIKTRKASMVAQQMRLTGSSISHTLRRLRDVFDDELFIRRPHGLEPTQLALQIEPDIRRAVDAVQSALAGPTDFNPSQAEATLNVAANDREMAFLIPLAFNSIMEEAPSIKMSAQALSRQEALTGLSDGMLDFAIGFFHDPGPQFDRFKVRTETYRVAAKADHAIWQAELSLGSYAAAKHVLVSGDGSLRGIVDQSLETHGKQRNVCLAVPSFLAALKIIADSNFVATLPASIVEEAANDFGLKYASPPIEIRPFDVSILTHRRNRNSPIHQWGLQKFRDATVRSG